jgi:hypothetical protein
VVGVVVVVVVVHPPVVVVVTVVVVVGPQLKVDGSAVSFASESGPSAKYIMRSAHSFEP